MIRHKTAKGAPKCKVKGFRAKQVAGGDPRLVYHWDDVNCPQCRKMKPELEYLKKSPRNSEENDTAIELARVNALAKEILERHLSGDVEDFEEE